MDYFRKAARKSARVGHVPIHPLLFAVAWVLSTFVSASPSPYAAMRALLVALVVAVVLTCLGRLLWRSWARGGIFAIAVLLVVTKGRTATVIADNIVRALPGWQTVVLAATLLAGVVAAAYLLRKAWARPRLAASVGTYLNVVGLVLCGLILISGISKGSFEISDLNQGTDLSSASRSSVARLGPDIYIIILDGYGRSDALRESYGYDNTPFLHALRERGFWVDPASHTNYSLTELAFTSLFHMKLLQDIPELQHVLAGEIPAQPTARRVLNDNPTFDFLRNSGYEIVANSIPYESPALRSADVYQELGGLNEFERQLVASSFLLDMTDLVDRDAMADDMRSQVSAELSAIPLVAEDQDLGPRLDFAHVLAPHTPFLFDAAGNPITSGQEHRHEDRVSPNDLSEEQYRSLLVDEIQYLDGVTLDAVDGLLAASEEPPVIIITADEGIRESAIEPAEMTPTEIRDVFGTLFAAYTPGRTDVFQDGTVTSQIMARLLNSYFGTHFPLASRETFVGKGTDPYHLTQVPEPAAPSS